MNNLHPVMVEALRGIAPPPSLNDDDVYVISLSKRQIIKRLSFGSAEAAQAYLHGIEITPGYAVATGMQARMFKLLEAA